jgi:hypothetical protein
MFCKFIKNKNLIQVNLGKLILSFQQVIHTQKQGIFAEFEQVGQPLKRIGKSQQNKCCVPPLPAIKYASLFRVS